MCSMFLSLRLCQAIEAKWVLLWRINQASLHWVIRNVITIPLDALFVENLHLRESALPHFTQISTFLQETMGESPLDQLHCLLNRHGVFNGQQQVHMIRHDHEVVKLELPFSHQGSEHIDKESCISFGLQQATAHAGFGGREKDASWVKDALRG